MSRVSWKSVSSHQRLGALAPTPRRRVSNAGLLSCDPYNVQGHYKSSLTFDGWTAVSDGGAPLMVATTGVSSDRPAVTSTRP